MASTDRPFATSPRSKMQRQLRATGFFILALFASLFAAVACTSADEPSLRLTPTVATAQIPQHSETPTRVATHVIDITRTIKPLPESSTQATLVPLRAHSPSPTPLPTGTIPQVSAEPAFPGLHFATFGDNPLLLTYPRDASNRVAVVEQEGFVSVFEKSPTVDTVTRFLDISARVSTRGNEEGLLGLFPEKRNA